MKTQHIGLVGKQLNAVIFKPLNS